MSARTRRKFKAYLVRQPDGKIGFEFEPRPVRAAKGAKSDAANDAPKDESDVPPRRAVRARAR